MLHNINLPLLRGKVKSPCAGLRACERSMGNNAIKVAFDNCCLQVITHLPVVNRSVYRRLGSAYLWDGHGGE